MVDVSKSVNRFDQLRFDSFCEDNNLKFPQEYVDYLKIYNDGDLAYNRVEFQNNATNIQYFYGTSPEAYGDLCAKIKPAVIEDIPHYSPFQTK